jgi:hypothetical protein
MWRPHFTDHGVARAVEEASGPAIELYLGAPNQSGIALFVMSDTRRSYQMLVLAFPSRWDLDLNYRLPVLVEDGYVFSR